MLSNANVNHCKRYPRSIPIKVNPNQGQSQSLPTARSITNAIQRQCQPLQTLSKVNPNQGQSQSLPTATEINRQCQSRLMPTITNQNRDQQPILSKVNVYHSQSQARSITDIANPIQCH